MTTYLVRSELSINGENQWPRGIQPSISHCICHEIPAQMSEQEMLDQMHEQLVRVCESWRCELLEFNGEEDHVHLLIDGHPAVNFSRMVGNLKTVSARHMRALYTDHLRQFYWKKLFWASSYAVFTVGATSLETVVQYIRNQEAPEAVAPASLADNFPA